MEVTFSVPEIYLSLLFHSASFQPKASNMKLYCHPEVLVGQWLQEANDGRGGNNNVHLVCDDGTLAWSTLLLASNKVPVLAESIRTLDRCSFCTQPTVVFLPGFR